MGVSSVTSIGKASGEGSISLGTEAWNIADGFTKIKILRLTIQLDIYEAMANFGYSEVDDPNINYELIPRRRVEGFERLIFTLKQLIGNCRFSIDDKKDRHIIDELMERIKNVENVADGIAQETWNDLTKEMTIRINDEHIKRCLNVLREIKDDLNFPINRAGLIFRQSDELDLDKITREIIEGG